jgi:hypothetical protein
MHGWKRAVRGWMFQPCIRIRRPTCTGGGGNAARQQADGMHSAHLEALGARVAVVGAAAHGERALGRLRALRCPPCSLRGGGG